MNEPKPIHYDIELFFGDMDPENAVVTLWGHTTFKPSLEQVNRLIGTFSPWWKAKTGIGVRLVPIYDEEEVNRWATMVRDAEEVHGKGQYHDCKGKHLYPTKMDRYCGAYLCENCGHHKGLARCFCGWSTSGQDGRRELIEMGEIIDDE